MIYVPYTCCATTVHGNGHTHVPPHPPQPQALFRPVDHVLDAAHSIIHELGGRYCALHVRRGDKLKEVEGLDAATQPDAIVASIKHLCKSGRALYIGSNEADASFFEPLKEHYTLFTYRYG